MSVRCSEEEEAALANEELEMPLELSALPAAYEVAASGAPARPGSASGAGASCASGSDTS